MKTKVTFITVAVFLVSFFSSASELPKGEILKKDTIQQIFDIRINRDNLVVLRASTVKKNKRQSFIVKVYSEKGTLLYANTFLKKGDALIPFDISSFPKGIYSFNIYKGLKEIYSKKITKGVSTGNQDLEAKYL